MKINEKIDFLITQAVNILNKGGLIIFPTDTAFGVGCRLDNKKAIERLFKIRKRPKNQAVPVLVSNINMAEEYLTSPLPKIVRQLMKEYWPGALTIVYPCKTFKVPLLVRGGGKNLGIRKPNHPIPLKLIKSVGVPLLGPSANFHGLPTPYCFEDLDKDFIKLVDFIIPGECSIGRVSTVIDCSKKTFKILRQGALIVNKNYLL